MPFTKTIRPVIIAVAIASTASPQAVRAGGWDFVPRVSVTETYTDNVSLEESNTDSDFITVIRPGFTLRRTGGARSYLDMDFSHEEIRYVQDSTRDGSRQRFAGNGGVELLEDAFFIDATASISQAIVSNQGAESATEVTDEENRTQIVSTFLNPNYRVHLGSFADWRNDYSINYVRADSDAINTTTTQRIASSLASGRDFAFLNWSAIVSRQETTYSESDRENSRSLVQLETQYVDRILVQPIVSVGYEKIEDETLAQPPDGLVWSVGGLIQPGPRTSVRVTYGRRYDEPNTSLDASYELSSRTTIRATFDQVLQTGQSLAAATADPTTIGPTNQGFDLTNDTVKQSTFAGSLDATRGRNTYNLRTSLSKRETDATGEESTVQSVSVSWQRRLNRFMTGSMKVNYRNTDTEAGSTSQVSDLVTLRTSLDYRLAADWNAAMSYTRSMRKSTDDTAEYTENTVSVSLRATF